MLALVRRARRRLFRNELFAQGANASSAALFAFILLLLLGTEILTWQVVIVMPTAALALGVWIARRRLASEYRTAQILDHRMGLADTLSTALYYKESGAKGPEEVIRLQAEAAERAAATVDVRRALPYTMPRAAYAVAALFVVAGSLFALRYGVMRQLDLKQPLATILHDTFRQGKTKTEQAKAKMPKVPRPDVAQDQEFSLSQEQMSQDPQQGNQADEGEIPGKAEAIQAEKGSKQSKDGSAQSQSDQDEASADRDANNGENPNSGQKGNQDGKPGNPKQDPNNSGDNNSLMSKVKDAVQNLLSRMKPPQQGGQQSGEQKGQQGKGQQNGGKQQSAKNSQQQGGEQSESQDGQAGEQAENAQQQQGKSQGNSDSKQASKQPGSGVGSQDGDKRVKAAEQLAAMGKISEILGKRAQTLTGETTVEVQSTSQQLRTQYTRGSSQHTQGGAEINRDEVPVALQSYVENYFEQVRKTAPAQKK